MTAENSKRLKKYPLSKMVIFHCHVSFLDGTCTNKTLVSCDVLRFSISHCFFAFRKLQSWCYNSWEPNPPTESKKWKKSWRGVHPPHHPIHEVSLPLDGSPTKPIDIRRTSPNWCWGSMYIYIYIWITGCKPDFWSIGSYELTWKKWRSGHVGILR